MDARNKDGKFVCAWHQLAPQTNSSDGLQHLYNQNKEWATDNRLKHIMNDSRVQKLGNASPDGYPFSSITQMINQVPRRVDILRDRASDF